MSGEVNVRVKNALDRMLPGHDVYMANKLTNNIQMKEWSHNQNRVVTKTVPFSSLDKRIFPTGPSVPKKGHEYVFWFTVNQYFPFVYPRNEYKLFNDKRNRLQSFRRAIFTRGFFKYKGYKRIRVSEGDRYSSKHKEDRVYIFEDANGTEIRLKSSENVPTFKRAVNFDHWWGTHWYFVHDPLDHTATTNLPGRFVTGPVDIMEAPENVLREREKRTYHHGYRNNAARFIQHHFRDMVYNPDRPLGRRRMMEGKARFNAVVRQSA